MSESSSQYIEPIDAIRQQDVIESTQQIISKAGKLYGRSFAEIPVVFNLKGLSAGMYTVKGRKRMIRFNPHHFAKYYELSLAETVPHEVAHYVTDMLYGLRNVRPHGQEWKDVMRDLGVEPRVFCDYDMAGIPVRKTRTHTYFCPCTTHQLSSQRHNRILRRKARYYCLSCKQELSQHQQMSLNLEAQNA